MISRFSASRSGKASVSVISVAMILFSPIVSAASPVAAPTEEKGKIASKTDAKVGSGEEFCAALVKTETPKTDKVSLGHFRTALESIHAVKGTLGSSAKNAGAQFEKQGFVNVKALKATDLPLGTIFVLNNGKDCATQSTYGDVAVKCAPDRATSPGGSGARALDPLLALPEKCFAGVMVKPALNPKKLCAGIKAQMPKKADRYSLRHLAEALYMAGEIPAASLGASAKLSVPKLKDAGFKNVRDYDDLPIGSVLVLEKKGGCPVNGAYGHVVAKCGSDELYWGPKKRKKLSTFVTENPDCVKAALFHPAWLQAEVEPAPPVGTSGKASKTNQ